MGPETKRLLKRLLECHPGTGFPLNTPEKRTAASLVRAGLVEWVQGGRFCVYRATEKARKENADLFTESP
jgi:hypothetical protein